MSDLKKYWAVAQVNFRRTTWIAYLVAGICVLAGIVDMILDRILNTGDITLAVYNYLYPVCLLAPILIASVNYTKFMNLGVKKKTYLWGCGLTYLAFAAIISLIGMLETYTVDKLLGSTAPVYGLVSAFGWDSSILTAFFCPFAFLLFVQAVIHTLTFMQTKWYGWAADALLVVIISVFTPIPALRQVEVWFFNLVIFAKPAILQVAICLILAALVYVTNLFYLRNRSAK